MKNLRFILTLALALLGADLYAQGIHTIDLKTGATFNSFIYDGDVSAVRGTAYGYNGAIRYTFFFDGHVGAYAQLGAQNAHASEALYFGTADKADGGKYLYRFSSGTIYHKALVPTFTLGAAYRFDFGLFNITPRIGAGLAWNNYCLEYERCARDGQTGPEYYLYEYARKSSSVGYLIDAPESTVNVPVLLLGSSIQFSYSVADDISLFIEPGIDWTPAPINIEKTVTPSARMYEPENWVEAVAYASGADQWQIDYDSRKTEKVSTPSTPFFYIDLGLRIKLY